MSILAEDYLISKLGHSGARMLELAYFRIKLRNLNSTIVLNDQVGKFDGLRRKSAHNRQLCRRIF
jgi:hypothetical protein